MGNGLHDIGGNGPWRVLHLVSTFQTKTDTKWLVQMARHLDRGLFQLSAACFYDGGPIRDQLRAIGVRTYNLDIPGERDPRAIIQVRRLIKDVACDIVHTHLLRADLYGGLAARWAGVPAIVSTAYAIGRYRRERRRWCDGLLDAACAALPTHIVAVSEAVRRDCVDRLHVDPRRVTVIRTGIDPPGHIDPDQVAGVRAEWGVGSDAPLVVTVARLSYEKGVDDLVDAAELLAKARPDVHVVIVGDGPDRGALEGRIQRQGLGDVVCLAGFRADIWPVLAAADVVCVPSKSEGMPNVLLEAMAVGRPIVATAVGGIPEVIVSRVNGLLVEPANAGQLAAAVTTLIENRGLAERLGEAARRTAAERFMARDVVAAYAELYLALAHRGECGSVRLAAAS